MHSPIEKFLAAEDGAGKLLAHARLLAKLARIFAEVAPTHLAQASCLANYRTGIIFIHAANGAVAAKLRQLAPRLANEFSVRGFECSGVHVKVQAAKTLDQSNTSTVRPLSDGARREIAGLRAQLPDSALNAALGKLLERAATAK